MRRRALAALSLVAGAAALAPDMAAAQILSRSMTAPRPFGVILGDVFTLSTRVDVAPPFKLDQSALPKPGPVSYWLDLRSIEIKEASGPNGATRYEIAAEYQTFYAALEAIEQTVPPLKLVVTAEDGRWVEADGASWSFITSPLRPIVATAGGGGSAYSIRPDAAPVRPSLRRSEIAAAAAGAAALLALGLLAWSRAWPPFHKRPARPFAIAARMIARQARDGEPGWRSAALSLHRAFDAAAGKRLLGDDIAAFLAARPAFARFEPPIRSFFEASRQAFFGAGATSMPPEELLALAKNLASAERAS